MTVTCPCGRPVDGSYLCQACTRDLSTTLEQIPDLLAELDVTLTRQAVHNHRGGARSAEKPLPYDPRASEAGWVLRNTITTWCRLLAEENGLDMPKTGPVRQSERIGDHPGTSGRVRDNEGAHAALWLREHIHHLRRHPAAGEANDEITQAAQEATRVIDTPGIDRTYCGPCDCGRDVYAPPGAGGALCPCGAFHDVQARRDQMKAELHDHLGTATYVATIATGLGTRVTPEAITIWHDRHYLQAIHSSRGRLYRVGDVLDVAQADLQWRKQRAKEVQERMSA